MTSEEFEQYVKQLLNVEFELNKTNYLGIPIGGLFSKFLFRIGQDRLRDATKYKSGIHLKLLVRTVLNYRSHKFKIRGDMLIIKANERESHNRLMNPIIDHYRERATIFSNRNQNAEVVYKLNTLPALSIKDTLRVTRFLVKNFLKFKQIFKKNKVEVHPTLIFFTFLRQLLCLQTVYNILSESKLKLIICDFDRNPNTNFFILAGQKFGIRTVTLVHGAIYPPYGFAPVLADEIWCWGNFQKKQLIEMDVAPEKIRVFGNSMAELKHISDDKKNQLRHKYNIEKYEFVIGLALQPIGRDNNLTMLELVLEALPVDFKSKVVILAKPHPRMRPKEIADEFYNSANVVLFDSHKDTNYDFFGLINIIFSRGSSIAFESVAHNVPSVIIDNDKDVSTKGNMDLMVQNLNCPIFSDVESLHNFLLAFLKYPAQTLKQLIEPQQNFVFGDFYYKTGLEADKENFRGIDAILS